MAGLEGTIHTPVGTVSKKTALMLGGGAVLIGGIIWYRQQKLSASTPTTPEAEIDPATGYPYGSPEDAAALAGQNSYVSPPVGGGGGGSSVPSSNVGYTSNGQWTQAAIETMTNNGSISDPGPLSAALGKYITGAYVAADDGNTNSLIQQAISTVGYPPISGPGGYPPSINRTPPISGTPTDNKPGSILHLRATNVGATSVTLAWDEASKSKGYDIQWYEPSGFHRLNTSVAATYTAGTLSKNHTYTFNVRARPYAGSAYGDWATVTVKTKAK